MPLDSSQSSCFSPLDGVVPCPSLLQENSFHGLCVTRSSGRVGLALGTRRLRRGEAARDAGGQDCKGGEGPFGLLPLVGLGHVQDNGCLFDIHRQLNRQIIQWIVYLGVYKPFNSSMTTYIMMIK
jgi:hypothetical protein